MQCLPTIPIPGPFATHAENNEFPPADYTGKTIGSPSVVPDPPGWQTLQPWADYFPPPRIPVLEYRPMELRRQYINNLPDSFSVESVQQAVGSGTLGESGRLSKGQRNIRKPSDDVWVPSTRPPAGQVTSCKSSGGTGAGAEIHPTTHVPGPSKDVMYRIGERGEEVALRAE